MYAKKIIPIVLVMVMFIMTIFSTNVNAAGSFNATASKTEVTVGDKITITVSATNASGTYSVTADNSNVTLSSGNATDFLDNSSASITFTASKVGTVTITAKATDMTDNDDDTVVVTGSKSFTITIKDKEEEKPTTPDEKEETPSSTEPTVTFKDVNETVYATTDVNVRKGPSTSDSSLGSLQKGKSTTRTGVGSNGWSRVKFNGGIAYIKSDYLTTTKPKEEDVTFTDVNETVYATADVNIRKGPSTSDSSLGSLQKGKSATRTGVGSNGWSRIKYNGGVAYIKSSYLTTTEPKKEEEEKKETETNSNLNLKTLEVKGQTLVPEFLPDKTSYSLKVSADVEKLEIKALPEKDGVTVSIKGHEKLKEGENVVTISVNGKDGEVKIYEIKVEKLAEEITGLALKSLIVEGTTKEIEFKPGVYNYETNIEDAITKLVITATPNEEDATVEILGNEDLKDGENVITIIVSSKDGEEKVTYQIKAIKGNVAEEEKEEEKSKAIINPDFKLYIYIGAFAVLLLALIIVVIYAIRHRKDDDDDYEDDIPEALKKGIPQGGLYNQDLDPGLMNQKPIDQGSINEVPINEEQIPNTKVDYDYKDQDTRPIDPVNPQDIDDDRENRGRYRGRHF